MLRRKPRRDPVSPELREYVLDRDKGCLAAKTDDTHVCKDQWGNKHSGWDRSRLTLDHVHDHAKMGRRAPSDPQHLVALCWDANVNGWASAHRSEERAYLALVEDPHAAHVDPCGPTCTAGVLR